MASWHPRAPTPAIIARLHDDFTSLMQHPDVEARLRGLNLEPAPILTSAQFHEMIRRETAMWAVTAKKLGLYTSE